MVNRALLRRSLRSRLRSAANQDLPGHLPTPEATPAAVFCRMSETGHPGPIQSDRTVMADAGLVGQQGSGSRFDANTIRRRSPKWVERSICQTSSGAARGVPGPALCAGRLAWRDRHLQANHVGRRARHRPGSGRLHPDHAQGPARTRRRQPADHGRPRGHAGPVVPSAPAPRDIELAGQWYSQRSAVRAYPHRLWQSLLDRNAGDDILLPIDVAGFAGGQTFLAGMPCLAFEGPGGLVSYLEPAMCRYFAPIIQATKARLMKLATPRDAEFGLRRAERTDQPGAAAGPLRRRPRPAHLQRHGGVPLSGAVPLGRHHRP